MACVSGASQWKGEGAFTSLAAVPPVNGSTVARRRGGAAVGLALVSWVIVLIVFARVFARVCMFLM